MRHDPEAPGIGPDGRPLPDQPRWRQDFPIDLEQDNYVARRDFTKFMVLTSFALAVGQIWIGLRNYFRRGLGQPPMQAIATLKNLPVGGAIAFHYPGPSDPCVLIRHDEQTLLAYSQKCTHLSCAVLPDNKRNCLYCPCHEGEFDLLTGRPTAGPPRRPLPQITLTVKGDVIYATGVLERTV